MEDHNEIQEIMSRSYGVDDVDEDDLEAGASMVVKSDDGSTIVRKSKHLLATRPLCS